MFALWCFAVSGWAMGLAALWLYLTTHKRMDFLTDHMQTHCTGIGAVIGRVEAHSAAIVFHAAALEELERRNN